MDAPSKPRNSFYREIDGKSRIGGKAKLGVRSVTTRQKARVRSARLVCNFEGGAYEDGNDRSSQVEAHNFYT